ncbi:MAG: chromosome segregation protein SMC [bacterium]|nr:chromosome segregation protein SMC [bacterium]
MLTALELTGFKSFAEKTRFDFSDGITVIVGPNGSGKSNVVDAIKWVLGAQSAKSLRGKDMIDVIFKGSNSSGRKPLNSAEATLVFDNREQRLAIDANEVHVTRRVYRSGEGEYLINGQACRLKDIKDLFRGTGVGVDAYSLIEQGKVDRMLQASPKDRRLIFEEAAGISRFNAKKAEANRRLERVEQNLVRLKDIVDEVHLRLNRLKSQATKAQKYREMTSRLHELRIRLGWTEYTQLTERTQVSQARLLELQADREQQQAELEVARNDAQRAEMDLHEVARACQDVEGRLQTVQQRIAVCQNQQQALRARILDLQEAEHNQSLRLSTIRVRLAKFATETKRIERELQDIQSEYDEAVVRARAASAAALELRNNVSENRERQDSLRAEISGLQTEHNHARKSISEMRNLWATIRDAIENSKAKLEARSTALEVAAQRAEQAAASLAEIQAETSQAQQAFDQARQASTTVQTELASYQEQAATIQAQLGGQLQRLSILEQLQQQQEGVDAGARYIIDLAKHSADSALQSVHGLLADLLKVDVQLAPLIDTALGPQANILVLEDGSLIQRIRSGEISVPGRLSLMRLDRIPARRFAEKVQLEGVDGVVGRADRLVRCKNKFMPLVRYFLGTTWVVETLEIALELGHFRGAGLRFVSTAGELIESDGLLTIGALQSTMGLVSRRSEIEAAKTEIAKLKTQQQQLQELIDSKSQAMEVLLPQIAELEKRARSLEQETARQQAMEQSASQSLASLRTELEQLTLQHQRQLEQREQLDPQLAELESSAQELQARIDTLEGQRGRLEQTLRNDEKRLTEAAEEETSTQVRLARAEQKLEAMRVTREQGLHNHSECLASQQEAERDMQLQRHKKQSSELEILELTAQLAEAYLVQEAEDAELDQLAARAQDLRDIRTQTAKHLEHTIRTLEKTKQQSETCELELERYRDSCATLLKRFSEDYQIELKSLEGVEAILDPEEQRQLDEEASQLRQDVASVGEINMAALAELDELQGRYDYLNGQYEDLLAAKESLQRIIQKINQDSRRMFTETLQIIRQNFQKLYRKSFGGGNADIILEDGQDVLEGGIEIIATPPGKTALSNSLLSGGEKALTAVALLLAIFQYRPSPFCVLDEVDAPFDEANIGRFVSVLNEFLDWTKFIVVTHSKKTMTAATTLYGVTMEESGVSKQVAVRFEDVNDKGEIINHKAA